MLYTATFILYCAIILLATINALVAEYSRYKFLDYIFRGLCFLILWIPAALRYDIGTDYAAYAARFYGDFYDPTEFGLYMIFDIVKYFGGGVEWAFAIVALLTYFPICFGMPKRGYTITIFFFSIILYLSTYNLIRQDLAVCIIAFAFVRYLIIDYSKLKFLIFVLIASIFHASALLCLLFVFIRPIQSHRLMLIIISVAIAFTFLVDIPSAIFDNALFQASRYADYADNQYSRATELGSGLGVLIKLCIPLTMFIHSKKLLEYDDKFTFVIFANLLYLCTVILSSHIYIFGRLAALFIFAPVVSLGLTFEYLGRTRKLELISIMLLYSAYFYVSIYVYGAEMIGVCPYQSHLGIIM